MKPIKVAVLSSLLTVGSWPCFGIEAGFLATTPPPPQYDVTPPMSVFEIVLPLQEVHRICSNTVHVPVPPGLVYWGCASITQKTCFIWRIDDKRVRRHEMGHCAGWPEGHPGLVTSQQTVTPKRAHP